MTPEEERAALYYGPPGSAEPGHAPTPDMTGAFKGRGKGAAARVINVPTQDMQDINVPTQDMQDINVPTQDMTSSYYGAPPPPPQPWRPVGAQLSQVGNPQGGEFQGTSARVINVPTQDMSDPPGAPPPGASPIAELRRASAAMNAEAQGAPPHPANGEVSYKRAGELMAEVRKADKDHSSQPSAPGNADPYGIKGARKGLYGTFDSEEGAMQRGATNEEGRADTMASGMTQLAMQQQKEAERQAVEASHAAELFSAHLAESQKQLDDVRSEKVNPNRLYQDTGSKIMAVLGGVLGGMYMGMNKLEKNPFLEDMNRAIQQDIALQERELGRKSESIKERHNLLGQMRSAYKDENAAKIQATNLYYEGAKQKLSAEAATYDSPAIQARADQAIQGLDRQQKGLKLHDALQAAAQAQAASAARHAAEKEEREFNLKVEEARTHRISAEKEGKGGGKEEPALKRFVPTGQREGDPTGYLAGSAAERDKNVEKRAAREELKAELEAALSIRKAEGGVGRALNREGQLGLWTPEWQTKLRQASAATTLALNKASGAGALDKGTEPLYSAMIGDMQSVGSKSDVQLQGLIDRLERANEADERSSGGVRATKRSDESIEGTGGVTAPNNSRSGSPVRRQAP